MSSLLRLRCGFVLANPAACGVTSKLVRDVHGAGLRAARLDSTSPPLLAVPAGTGNSFYRAIWHDRPWQTVFDDALMGMATAHWIGMARIPETGTDVLPGTCSALVAEALVAAGIQGLAGRDKYDRAVLANGGGGRHRGGRHTLLRRSVLDDGLLDACVIGGEMDLRELSLLMISGSHVGHPAVAYRRDRGIRIERTDGMPLSFEHDGELFLPVITSYTIAVAPRAFLVLTVADSEN
jgi:diacylglycerol kinase (ATP)